MEFFLIYVFVVVDQLREFIGNAAHVGFVFVVVVGFLTVIGLALYTIDSRYTLSEVLEVNHVVKLLKILKRVFIASIVCVALSAIIPSQKDVAIIVAGGVTYNVLTSDRAKEIGGKSLDLLDKKMNEALADEPAPEPTVVQ